jgi:hypothetical protein
LNTYDLYFLLILAMVATLGVLLLWSLRRGETSSSRVKIEPSEDLEIPGGHVVHLAQIQQALQESDLSFLALHGSRRLSRQVRRERRQVVLRYLSALRMDFERLLRLARVIAVLSPEVAPAQEWERLRLSLRFSLQCELVRMELVLGRTNLPQLSGVSRTVSGLALRLERAMTELGERAALATELASALNR